MEPRVAAAAVGRCAPENIHVAICARLAERQRSAHIFAIRWRSAMKRIVLRASALVAVLSLGTFAVVEAQRSARTADAAAVAEEPAAFVVDERMVKPMPQPTALETASDGYAPVDGQATGAVDPFAAQAVAASDSPFGAAESASAVPPAESQAIPTAAEAMRRYERDAASRRQLPGRGEVRPLRYDDGDSAIAGQSPDDVNAQALLQPGRNEPTLAPPRAGSDRYAQQQDIPPAAPLDEELPGDAPDADLVPEAADANFPNDMPREAERELAAPADRYERSAARRATPREPALLPDKPIDDDRSTVPAADDNFARRDVGNPIRRDAEPFSARGDDNFAPPRKDNFAPPERTRPDAVAEGAGRPGGRHLEGPQTPHLTLERVAPPEIQVGKPATFVLKIRNTGQVAAAHVEIHDSVPKGTQLLSTTPRAAESAPGEVVWSLGTLKPGEETSVELELMPVAEGEVGSVATVHFAAESSVRTMVTKPVLSLDIKAPREVLLGEDVTMAIKISNTGTGAATGLVLREAVPDLLQHPAGPELEYEVGVLKPGETRELDLTMRCVKAGRLVNSLSAVGEGSVRGDQQAELEVVAPALAVKMDGPGRRYLDRQVTYTVSVSNPGTAAAKEISLVTYLPAGLKFVEANNAGQYDPRTRAVAWLLDELPPNESGSVSLTAVPVETGEQLVRIESTAQRGLSAQEEKMIVVEGVAAINFEVVDVADPIEVGGETAYEVRVVNQGTKAATNVQVVALLPEELKPTGGEGPARYTIDGQRVLFEPLAQLAPKADTTYRVKAQGRAPGDVRVRVQILTDEIRSPVTKEESTRVYADE
jgi:uncharacterized repeat protein (TIGR01451 family)